MRIPLPALLLLLSVSTWAQTPAPAVVNLPTSDEARLKLGVESVVRIRALQKEIQVQLEEARRTRDIVKLNCVMEKLTAVKALLRVAEQSGQALHDASVKGQSKTVEHELVKISLARQKAERQRTESEECIGQLAFGVDDGPAVEVEGPAEAGVAEPTAPEPILGDPPASSPLF